MKYNKIYLLALLATAGTYIANLQASEHTPNTLISIHKVQINNKDMPMEDTYRTKGISYQLINEDTKDVRIVYQGGKARAIYLEPGRYCFKSMKFSPSSINNLKIYNPSCFDVSADTLSNAGTWVIGYRVDSSIVNNHVNYNKALLLDMKKNYSELESILNVSGSLPVAVYQPSKK